MSWSDLSPRERARLRAIVLQRDGHRCQIRKPGICTTIATTADHIVDRAIAGDGPDNLRAACGPCNFSRGMPGREDPEPRSGGWV
jgi:5-methylcytosine-specific restriction endonuclease McrA